MLNTDKVRGWMTHVKAMEETHDPKRPFHIIEHNYTLGVVYFQEAKPW